MYLDLDLEIDTQVEVDGVCYSITGSGYFIQQYEDSSPYLEAFTGEIYEMNEGKEVFSGELKSGPIFDALYKDCWDYERVFEIANEKAYYKRIGFDD